MLLYQNPLNCAPEGSLCPWAPPPEKAGACDPSVLGCPNALKGACTGVPNGALPPLKLPKAGVGVDGVARPLPNGDCAADPDETVGDPRPNPPKPASQVSHVTWQACRGNPVKLVASNCYAAQHPSMTLPGGTVKACRALSRVCRVKNRKWGTQQR